MKPILVPAMLLLALAACDGGEPSGHVVGELTSDRIELSAESNEPIIEIAVAEGATVEAGDLLVVQNPARARLGLEEAEAALAQAQARIEELVRGPRSERIQAARATVAGARQESIFRQSEYARAQRIFEQQLSSQESLERARAAADSADAELERAGAELAELLSGTTAEELRQAESAARQATARREAAALDLSRLEIRAPVAGRIDSRLLETGERPTPGEPIMIMLTGAQPHARVYVPEALRAQVQVGGRAEVLVDGLAQALAGRVRWVASEAAYTPYYALTERDRGRLSYLAKVDIAFAGSRLPEGVPVEVVFATDQPAQ